MNVYKNQKDKPNPLELGSPQTPLALCRALVVSLHFQKIGEATTNMPLSEFPKTSPPVLDWPRLTPLHRVVYTLLPCFPDIVRDGIVTRIAFDNDAKHLALCPLTPLVLTWVTFGLGLAYCFLANSSLLLSKKGRHEDLICIKCQAGFASCNLTPEKIRNKLSY
jgi:hypothetical protein